MCLIVCTFTVTWCVTVWNWWQLFLIFYFASLGAAAACITGRYGLMEIASNDTDSSLLMCYCQNLDFFFLFKKENYIVTLTLLFFMPVQPVLAEWSGVWHRQWSSDQIIILYYIMYYLAYFFFFLFNITSFDATHWSVWQFRWRQCSSDLMVFNFLIYFLHY